MPIAICKRAHRSALHRRLKMPSEQASARVFLRVLRDALFTGPGSSDLLLPVVRLSELFPDPALTWLRKKGVPIHLSTRVMALRTSQGKWLLDDRAFDRVVSLQLPDESSSVRRADCARMGPDRPGAALSTDRDGVLAQCRHNTAGAHAGAAFGCRQSGPVRLRSRSARRS